MTFAEDYYSFVRVVQLCESLVEHSAQVAASAQRMVEQSSQAETTASPVTTAVDRKKLN